MLISVRPFKEIIRECEPNFNELLSDEDIEKSAIYRREDDRFRFIAARILCYEVMNLHYSMPSPMIFEYSELGKPSLNGVPEFNWSHSGEYIAFFCATGAGIDIELFNELDPQSFSAVFTGTQLKWIGSSRERFFMLWTIKESVMKSTGLGFQLNPLELDPIFTNATNDNWELHFDDKIYFGKTIIKQVSSDNETYAISFCTTDSSVKLDKCVLL
ncbi:MAG: 4'-phosphopantetheinyl transferase superfamily protein [Balneolales bacterium]|nr:4'-phosphopantetheinyl transferase superfamily protein [Balneolales bacterium]